MTRAFALAPLFLVACATTGERPPPAGKPRPPNVIFIMADDLGYADLGAYGGKRIPTPQLDRLAAEGTRFTQHYAGAPVCAPSRSVLLTGQHTGHTRVRGNTPFAGPHKGSRVPLEPEDVTLAEVMKQAGYATGMIGKWGLGEPGSSGEPNRQGFDEWFGYLNQRHAHTYYPDHLWNNASRHEIPENRDGKRAVYSHDLFTDRALDFVRRHKERPFFLYLPFTLPHGEHEIPSLGVFADQPWSDLEKRYAAMVHLLDRDVGRIVQLLRELGIAEDTLVFFTSDNGVAEGIAKLSGFASSGPLRGHKREMTEGGIRVPMIAWGPGRVPSGKVSAEPWYAADVLPTLAALAGVSPPPGIDGVDVAPVLLGRKQTLGERALYWEFHEGHFQQAARIGKWKVIRSAPRAPLELYDLDADVGESQNVATHNPEVIARFEAYLRSARTESVGWPIREPKPLATAGR